MTHREDTRSECWGTIAPLIVLLAARAEWLKLRGREGFVAATKDLEVIVAKFSSKGIVCVVRGDKSPPGRYSMHSMPGVSVVFETIEERHRAKRFPSDQPDARRVTTNEL